MSVQHWHLLRAVPRGPASPQCLCIPARCAGRCSGDAVTCRATSDCTAEKNPLPALSVVVPSPTTAPLSTTSGYTQGSDLTSARCALEPSDNAPTTPYTSRHILATRTSAAILAGRSLLSVFILPHTPVFTRGTFHTRARTVVGGSPSVAISPATGTHAGGAKRTTCVTSVGGGSSLGRVLLLT